MHMHACTCVYTPIRIYVYICIYIDIYRYIDTYIHIYIYECVYMDMLIYLSSLFFAGVGRGAGDKSRPTNNILYENESSCYLI